MNLLAFACLSFFFAVLFFALYKLRQIKNIIKKNPRQGKDRKREVKEKVFSQKDNFSCAFFHPNCSAGGGGERTLWAALIALKGKFPIAHVIIFTKANVKFQNSTAEIKQKVMDDFNLEIPEDFQIIPLKSIFLAESQTWPRFTLIAQILGSIVVAFEAMFKFKPDLFIDTSGFPFLYPIIKFFFKCKIIAYVHYPFLSLDMIHNLRSKSYNNSGIIASSSVLSRCKLEYYKALMRIYSFTGMFCDLALTNSTWTNGHIKSIWKSCSRIEIVYPPCDLNPFTEKIRLTDPKIDPIRILSLSQFRPEKNHRLQVEIAAKVLKRYPEVKFEFIGGCRGAADEERVNELILYAKSLGLKENSIVFLKNLPFEEMLKHLKGATIGLHTMTDEHFGIGIVELMAAGLITIANNSGGPRADIIKKDTTGFLCTSATEYSERIMKVIEMSKEERLRFASIARKSVLDRFCSEIFSKSFSESVLNTINKIN